MADTIPLRVADEPQPSLGWVALDVPPGTTRVIARMVPASEVGPHVAVYPDGTRIAFTCQGRPAMEIMPASAAPA